MASAPGCESPAGSFSANDAAWKPNRSAVAEPRRPLAGALGEEVEEVPERAEIVAGAEAGVGDAQDAAVLPPEHEDARHPAAVLGAVAHVGREARPLVAHHGE